MEDILKVEHVSKVYGDKTVLDDVSLSVRCGEAYGLLGPNGAGKTTLIRIINHITAPDCGEVIFDGHRLTANDVAHIGYLPEERGLYKKMKVGEQAMFFAQLKGMSSAEARRSLTDWFDRYDIVSWWNRPMEELSKGMAQKVQFIITVLHRPKLLIFDEPFSGFDPVNANLLREEIVNLKNEGATLIFSTHNMASVEEICDDITLINHGKNVLTGNVEQLRRKFSEGRCRFVYKADSDLGFISPMSALLAESSTQRGSDGLWITDTRLADGVTLREAIAVANEAVELHNVSEIIASMNDIFISTVKEDNKDE